MGVLRRWGEMSLLRQLSSRGVVPTELEADAELPVIFEDEEGAEAKMDRVQKASIGDRMSAMRASMGAITSLTDMHVMTLEELEVKFSTSRTAGLSSKQVSRVSIRFN